MFLSLKNTLRGLCLTKNGCRMVENGPSLSHRSFPPFWFGALRETEIISSSRWLSDVRVSHLQTFKRKPNPFQPCGFKIEPPGSHCQLVPGLCHSASLDVKPLQVWSATLAWTRAAPVSKREPSRAAFTKSRQISSKKQLRKAQTGLARHQCLGQTQRLVPRVEPAHNWGCQAMIWLHLIKPACLQKLNSTH